MLTPKQKKQIRQIINKNPSVEYQEQLEDEQFALKEIKKFAERELIILKRQLEIVSLTEERLDLQKLEARQALNKLEDQHKDLQKEKDKLQKQIENLSDK